VGRHRRRGRLRQIVRRRRPRPGRGRDAPHAFAGSGPHDRRRPAGVDGMTLEGVLPVNKPAGMTSHDVVAKARRLLGERRIGHTGTLDPMATGVLPLVVGRATRLSDLLQDMPKAYEAEMIFGFSTDTEDITGASVD